MTRPLPAIARNYFWAYDLVFDACANGQQLECLSVVEKFSRKLLEIDVAGSIRSASAMEIFAHAIAIDVETEVVLGFT